MAVLPISKALYDELQRWCCRKMTSGSLKLMMEHGLKCTEKDLLIGAKFLHNELPIRLATRAVELDKLPHGLSNKPAVLKVRDWYLESFRDLRSFPEIKDSRDELDFTEMIKKIKRKHNTAVPMVALGVHQLKKELKPGIYTTDLDEIHQFLDRFYMSRIGIRMLIGQHVALHDPNPEPNCVGYINTKTSPLAIAQSA